MRKKPCDDSICAGCGACIYCCPSHAITMKADGEGFAMPCIDMAKCVKCGRCEETCVVLSQRQHSLGVSPQDVYAFQAGDEMRLQCSSGGVFPLLAKTLVSKGWYISGCILDEKLHPRHVVSCEVSMIARMSGAKYVQSDVIIAYSDILDLLKRGVSVLFVGTPCQVAAIKLIARDYSNHLLTIDLLCHGVSSEMLFRRNIKEAYGSEVDSYVFRDKSQGWSYDHLSRLTVRGLTKYVKCQDDAYFSAFLDAISLRKSCYDCSFATATRVGDLTLGDFWGVEGIDKRYSDRKGTSLVLVNTEKGRQAFDLIKSSSKRCSRALLDDARNSNQTLNGPTPCTYDRELFFSRIRNGDSVRQALECTKNQQYDFAIANFWWTNNYGAILTAYALQQVLLEMGYSSRLIAGLYGGAEHKYRGSRSERFARKHLKITDFCIANDDFTRLNRQARAFITGSDQVWRGLYSRPYHYLSFAAAGKKKIAVSASFGTETLDVGPYDKNKLGGWLSRFTAISTREDSGVKICKSEFSLEAQHILDPVFLLDKERYDALILDRRVFDGKGVVYVLDNTPDKKVLVAGIAKCLDKELVNLADANDVEDWLAGVATADFLITDSFHGVCFAIIFQRPFVCLGNNDRGNARFNSLFRTLGVSIENVFAQTSQQALEILKSNWQPMLQLIKTKLAQEQRRAREWLTIALQRDVSLESALKLLDFQEVRVAKLEAMIDELRKKDISFSRKLKRARYRLLSKITFGSVRTRYKAKYRKLQLG